MQYIVYTLQVYIHLRIWICSCLYSIYKYTQIWASLNTWIPNIHPSCGFFDTSSIAFVCIVSTCFRHQGLWACRQGKGWQGKSYSVLETQEYLLVFSEPEARQCQTREIFSMFLPDIYGSLKLAGYLIYRPSLSTCVHPSVIYPSIHPLTVYHPSSWASRLCPLSCISCSLFFLASLFICWFSMV